MRSNNRLANDAHDLARARARRELRLQNELRAAARSRNVSRSMDAEAWSDAQQRRHFARWFAVMCFAIAGYIAVFLVCGCSQQRSGCHARLAVNGNAYHLDADGTSETVCLQLAIDDPTFFAQLTLGADQITVRDNSVDVPCEPIEGVEATATTASVALDVGGQHCENFRGTLRVDSPPPTWKVAIAAVCAADHTLTLDASLWGESVRL